MPKQDSSLQVPSKTTRDAPLTNKVHIRLSEYAKLPNPNLHSYFERTKRGNGVDYRTPFFEGMDREAALNEWDSIVLASNLQKKLPSLYAYEEEMRSKVGPLSIQKPLDQRLASVQEYFTGVANPGEGISDDAVSSAVAFLKPFPSMLRVRSLTNTLQEMRLSTNAGLPSFRKRRDEVEVAAQESVRLLEGRLTSPYQLAALLGWRGQEHGPNPSDVKQRVIWMMPFSLNIAELRVYQPLIAMAQRAESVPAWVSLACVDREMTRLFDTREDPSQLVICTDFTGFDQHFNAVMQRAALLALSSMFQHDDTFNDWVRNVFPLKYTLPLVVSEEDAFAGSHGMASGSGGTNQDETLAHKALQFQAAAQAGSKLNPHSQCLGDDGCLTYPGINVEQLVSSYSATGMVMNAEKQFASNSNAVYLRRWYDVGYRQQGLMVGVYSTYRAIGRLLGQERYYDPRVWSAEMVEMRYLSILDNCCYHPLYHELIDWVLRHDKFRLGLDIKGFYSKSAISERLRKLRTAGISFNGYAKGFRDQEFSQTPTDFLDSPTVKYLLSKYTASE